MADLQSLATGSIYFAMVSYIVVLIFSAYSLYLNWKQSKVRDEMQTTNELLDQIYQELKNNTQAIEELKCRI